MREGKARTGAPAKSSGSDQERKPEEPETRRARPNQDQPETMTSRASNEPEKVAGGHTGEPGEAGSAGKSPARASGMKSKSEILEGMMRDEMGMPNLDTGMGTVEEYRTSFYTHFTQETGVEISDEDKVGLEPLIMQAHEKGISTMDLVEIVKQGM